MKKIVLSALMSVSFLGLIAQKQITREAYLKFYSSTPVEDIEGATNKASSVLDLATGEFVCQVLMKSFHFEKALMQEHFNENYVESEKYPKAVFKGKILDYEKAIDLSFDQTINKKIKGTLLIHGIEKEIEVDCSTTVKKGKITQESVFYVSPADFNIEIPGAIVDKISDKIEVTFKAGYSPL
jgi:polyisoprenoid-binding protein YceI